MPFIIDQNYLKQTLKALLAIPSPGGLTAQSIGYITQALTQLGLPSKQTRRGALQGFIGDPAQPKIGFSAHVDTLGAMVKELKSNGRLGIVSIGSWSSRAAEGCRVHIHTESGTLYRGTILPQKASGHAYGKEIDTQPVAWEQLEVRVDSPCHDLATLEATGIQVGDILSVDPQTEILDNGYIVSRFLDDLAGAACLLTAAKAIKDQGLTINKATLLLFTTMEEVGTGAALNLPPSLEDFIGVDIAIVAPGHNSREDQLSLVFKDASGPYDPSLTRQLAALCKQHQLPYRRDVFKYYFSDCAAALQAGNDVRHALIGFGTDASHDFERTHIQALDAVVQLILATITQ